MTQELFLYDKSRASHAEKYATFKEHIITRKSGIATYEFHKLEALSIHGFPIGSQVSLHTEIFNMVGPYLASIKQSYRYQQFLSQNQFTVMPFQHDIYFAPSLKENPYALRTLTISCGDKHADRLFYQFLAHHLELPKVSSNKSDCFHAPKFLFSLVRTRFDSAGVPTPL